MRKTPFSGIGDKKNLAAGEEIASRKLRRQARRPEMVMWPPN
jgi:hypothetical protein